MFNIDELFSQVNRLKAKGKVLSNNFMDRSVIEYFSAQDESILTYNEDAIALICCDNGIARLYFYISSLEAAPRLRELLEQVPLRPVVVDCVGRQEHVDSLSRILCSEGFSLYTRMGRLRGQKTIICPDMGCVEKDVYAELKDTDEIFEGLKEIFDPFVSHLPSRDHLMHLIEQKLVYRLKAGGKVVAVICMELVGKNGIYCYQGYVSPNQRGKGYGRRIYQIAVHYSRRCRPFTTWVEDSNTQVLKMWNQFGFLPDGLRNIVLTYQ